MPGLYEKTKIRQCENTVIPIASTAYWHCKKPLFSFAHYDETLLESHAAFPIRLAFAWRFLRVAVACLVLGVGLLQLVANSRLFGSVICLDLRMKKAKKTVVKKSLKTEEKPRCALVAIGASAGGLDAFQEFFDQMADDSGMAFVLVQHLDPNHQTLMPELLAKHTPMPVKQIEDCLCVEPNHVYVIPPNAVLEMDKCSFRVKPLNSPPSRKVIDQFFCSVAEDQKENVIGIILSGTGFDGAHGLKVIKEHGGMTIAQTPSTARFESMPRSAISTGAVDHVLPVKEMPAFVCKYVSHLERLHQRKTAEAINREASACFPKIFQLLRKKTGHDFSRYKESTLIRRIQRRMQVVYLDSMAKYVEHLRENPHEVEALFKDLLIGVTQFFRDPKIFDGVSHKVIPQIFKEKGPDNTVRVWVPGCASGEEAYSFAILLAEYRERMKNPPQIQIFATDLDVEALEFARKARYPEDIAEQVSPERLKRFFKRVGSSYEAIDEIREMCIFSPHNLIKDPPFSRLDLISCRNLLIYLESDMQRRLLPLFHYALNPCGFLFLGPSENIASRSEYFRPIDLKHRIFQRKPTVLQAPVHVPLIDRGHVTKLQTTVAPQFNVPKEQTLARSIERLILEDYAPASVIINQQGDAMYFSGNTGKYLEPGTGLPTNKIINLARKNLRLELRTVIHRAVTTGQEVIRQNVPFKSGRDTTVINIIVRPLKELSNEPDLFIVVFQELVAAANTQAISASEFAHVEHPIIKQLENELRTVKDELQTTIEELETSNEELKSANEELLSMNEELQSGNEELQTSKEEMQSVNDELQRKMEELDAANNTTQQILRSITDGFAVLDKQWRFSYVNERYEDIARPLQRTSGNVLGKNIWNEFPELQGSDAELQLRRAMEQHIAVEFEYNSPILNRTFDIRAYPSENSLSLYLLDITERKRAMEIQERLATVVEYSDDAIVTKTLDGIVTTWNKGAERIFGYTAEEMIGKPIVLLIPQNRPDEEPSILARLRRGERIDHYETIRRRKDGTLIDVSLTVSPLRNADGRIIGASKIARDITAQKRAQLALQKANDELEQRVLERTASLQETTEQLETFCYTIAHDLRSPLRAQQSFAQILLDDYHNALDEAGRDYAQRIVASALRLDMLVHDLLTYSRLSRTELRFEPVELGKLIDDVEQALVDPIRASNATISKGHFFPVRAHAPTLEFVISNLFTNGFKFVKPGVTPHLNVWSETRGEFVRLWVEDNGIGIAPEHQQRIFGVFERLHPSDVYPGTGMGLAIVKKGVERMHGRVGLESTADKGSRFWLELPKAQKVGRALRLRRRI
jgi:two-component system, chemotaxis family, CheB/CheR fusion protein